MDYGHKLTDEELKELEKRINAEYTQAEKEVAQKLSNYLAGFMRRDIEQKTLVDAGEISEREYLNWRAGQIATGKRWEELRQSLAEDMHRTNVETQKQAQSESMDIYALNHNYGTYEVENGAEIDTKYTLYDRQTVERLVKDNPQMLPPPGKKVSERIKAGLDVRWNNQHIQSVMMQSLLQGESIGKIATRLANAVGDSNRAAAIRNARTMTTGAENAGRVDAYERAKDMGVPVRQMWVATIDERTRESHRKMDGETIEPGETFSNKCRFPGDPLGEPSEVYNCRCTLVARIPGVQYTFAERGTDKDSYEEWKKGKETEEKPQVEEQKTEEPKVEESKVEKVKVEEPEKTEEPKVENEVEVIHTEHPESYIKIMDRMNNNIKYNTVKELDEPLSSEEIINKIAGNDKTSGSCVSLSLAYAANQCGLDVEDFRGGESQSFFAKSFTSVSFLDVVKMSDLANTANAKIDVYNVKKSEIKETAELLKMLPFDKEYILCVGKHAAIVRNNDEKGPEYLELQSDSLKGWTPFAYEKKYTLLGKEHTYSSTIEDTLLDRFGCRKGKDSMGFSTISFTDVDTFQPTEEFKEIMGYINTSSSEQKKGVGGGIK